MIEIHPLKYDGVIGSIGLERLAQNLRGLFTTRNGDILVITHKAIARAEGRIIKLPSVVPSTRALVLAETINADPRFVQLVLQESVVMRVGTTALLTRMPNGMVCNNAGIDTFEVGSDEACLLPIDADASAKTLSKYLNVPVVISDTQSRFYRSGFTNVAIGSWGINPVASYIGKTDKYGNVFQRTVIAVVDELATAADLVFGKLDGIPAAVIRGYSYIPAATGAQIINDSKRYSRMELLHAFDSESSFSPD